MNKILYYTNKILFNFGYVIIANTQYWFNEDYTLEKSNYIIKIIKIDKNDVVNNFYKTINSITIFRYNFKQDNKQNAS